MPDSRVEYIKGDFFDDNVLSDVIKGKDIIYHALSTVNPGNSNQKYMMGYGRDFIQTVRLFDMLKETDTKLIFLSSQAYILIFRRNGLRSSGEAADQ